jgi:hypothetical protein
LAQRHSNVVTAPSRGFTAPSAQRVESSLSFDPKQTTTTLQFAAPDVKTRKLERVPPTHQLIRETS